ncbi:MAG: helix-turn-helix domain-containing protein [Thalassovita sp.]
MDTRPPREISNFGRHLRYWRDKRKLSQLELAGLAETTSRHISFIETGRSRPGHDLVLRLASAMKLPVRDVNILMSHAGFAPAYTEYKFTSETIAPYRGAIEAILEKHNPFPACAMDSVGQILLANKAFVAYSPDALTRTPEETIEQVFDPNGPVRQAIVNWEELVWTILDRQKAELVSNHNPRLAKLMARAEKLLAGVERPAPDDAANPIVFSPRLRVGDQIVSMFATLMRFENATEVNLSEIRVELFFPTDAPSKQFFETLYDQSDAVPFSGFE